MSIIDIVNKCRELSDEVILYIDDSNLSLPALMQTLAEYEIYSTILDRATIFNYDTLMHAFYQNCEFPSYFGFNWNALLDCIASFDWKPHALPNGRVLIYRNPTVLQEQDPTDWETLIEVLEDACKEWKERGVPFKLLIPSHH